MHNRRRDLRGRRLRQAPGAEQVYEAAFPSDDDDKQKSELQVRGLLREDLPQGHRQGRHGGIRIDDVEDVLVRFAKCCSPLPGDNIIGFITRGRGVTVHRRDCDKAMQLPTRSGACR